MIRRQLSHDRREAIGHGTTGNVARATSIAERDVGSALADGGVA